ncbi:hypothetical protein Pcinc_016523 [Petrolisthes cinctipes]|uniref:Uncharacterized protein n=1 Tax=Petrolisthes cinctipes TaxID=88211 RepID=A0AAE1FQZ0_PETCI|nr:hypothetical protein Pcinc_016523 [Petrolisthes cinctipes]
MEVTKVDDGKRSFKGRGVGLALVGLTGGTAVVLSVVAAPFVAPALRKVCLPYVPATTIQVNNVLRALRGRSGTLVDLGSGDGRIVVAAAREGRFKCTGIELNPWLVWYSRWSAWRVGVSSNTTFTTADLWRTNLTPHSNIVVFGVQEMMPDLEAKLEKELSSDGCVVACRFPFPSWTPTATLGEDIDTVWLYQRPKITVTQDNGRPAQENDCMARDTHHNT